MGNTCSTKPSKGINQKYIHKSIKYKEKPFQPPIYISVDKNSPIKIIRKKSINSPKPQIPVHSYSHTYHRPLNDDDDFATSILFPDTINTTETFTSTSGDDGGYGGGGDGGGGDGGGGGFD